MLHACVQRFDVTGNLEKFYKILRTKQALNSVHTFFISQINSVRTYWTSKINSVRT